MTQEEIFDTNIHKLIEVWNQPGHKPKHNGERKECQNNRLHQELKRYLPLTGPHHLSHANFTISTRVHGNRQVCVIGERDKQNHQSDNPKYPQVARVSGNLQLIKIITIQVQVFKRANDKSLK